MALASGEHVLEDAPPERLGELVPVGHDFRQRQRRVDGVRRRRGPVPHALRVRRLPQIELHHQVGPEVHVAKRVLSTFDYVFVAESNRTALEFGDYVGFEQAMPHLSNSAYSL